MIILFSYYLILSVYERARRFVNLSDFLPREILSFNSQMSPNVGETIISATFSNSINPRVRIQRWYNFVLVRL